MFHHITVLKEEAVDGLNIKEDGIYVDCTLGGAGHSEAIASRLGPRGRLIGLDQDDTALAHARERLAPYGAVVTLVKSNFRRLAEALREAGATGEDGAPQVDGVLFDLGVSSPQLDEADRGFSYNHDAELDMRMDQSQRLSAKEIVNEWDEQELARIFRDYGEEKFARKIARQIVAARQKAPIEKTGELAELIKSAIPAAARRTGGHPAKRTFQAIRIAVNDELGAFQDALNQAIEVVRPGGRIAVITFHSLEDRICKLTFAKEVATCRCPPDFPVCVCGGGDGRLRLTPRKPILPSERELEENNRARSAKLRIAERL
ncbi:16S rRNA (cytosine(1402)-N(4))-methyltransferase RsmH [Cohnella nanjingensis]|uniref:Ribosomal RNA small subunit methyltransferase H n=1 Tax=Cohnella nanjingensis TaxID=1387779 RepID=A0A7X0RTG0_9BACL|nr:16S rRNA (cytosine(1402)-N(4))-methyltransferase RsmH [Cohnella nanjingensis]MBB6673228.1 16S rRNA (cytosine(1402)-N(4))-methyltransferase RsmH [Cohnella nanjingensis]